MCSTTSDGTDKRPPTHGVTRSASHHDWVATQAGSPAGDSIYDSTRRFHWVDSHIFGSPSPGELAWLRIIPGGVILSAARGSKKSIKLRAFRLEDDEQAVWARRTIHLGARGYLLLTTHRLVFLPRQTDQTDAEYLRRDVPEVQSVAAVSPKTSKAEIALNAAASLLLTPAAPVAYFAGKKLLVKVVEITTTDGKRWGFWPGGSELFDTSNPTLSADEIVTELHDNLALVREHAVTVQRQQQIDRINRIAQHTAEQSAGDIKPILIYPEGVDTDESRRVYRAGFSARVNNQSREPPYAPRHVFRRHLWERGFDAAADQLAVLNPSIEADTDAAGLTIDSERKEGFFRAGFTAACAGEPRVSSYSSQLYRSLWERGYDWYTSQTGLVPVPVSVADTRHRTAFREGSLAARLGYSPDSPYEGEEAHALRRSWQAGYERQKTPIPTDLLEGTRHSDSFESRVQEVYLEGVSTARAGTLRRAPYDRGTLFQEVFDRGYDWYAGEIVVPDTIETETDREWYVRGVSAARDGKPRLPPVDRTGHAGQGLWAAGYDSTRTRRRARA